jgi:hypothetical protein
MRHICAATLTALVLVACSGSGEEGAGASPSPSTPSESVAPSPTPSPLSNGAVVQDALAEGGYTELQSIATRYIDDEAKYDCRWAKRLSTGTLGKTFARNLNQSEGVSETYTPEDGTHIVEIILSAYCPEVLVGASPEPTSACTGSGTHCITYVVSGASNRADITYENENQDASQAVDAIVPWRYAFDAEPGEFVYLSAQRGGAPGDITCTIELDGVVVESNSSSGAYSICTASGAV